MGNAYFKYFRLIVFAAMLPFVYGCVPGADVGSLAGFLFGGGGLGGDTIALLGEGAAAGGTLAAPGGSGAELATLHNPEPATMFLFGSGLMAMTYFKSKLGRRNK